jgi:GcrA cell cycle regulator
MSFDPQSYCPINEVWPLARINRLRDLAADGLSASAIGRELGCTKNGIVGKCRRMQIPLTQPNHMDKRAVLLGRPLVVRHVPVVDGATLPPLASAVAARKTPPAPEKPRAPEPPVAPPEPRHQCAWLDGERGRYLQCTSMAKAGSVYCASHHSRSYVRRSSLQPECAA